MFHHVSPVVARGPYAKALTISPQEFERELVWLQARGCRTVSVDNLVLDARRGILAPCETALTFDDGYDDVARYALPLLEQYHDVATFYIVSGYVGTAGHVSVTQLKTLRAAGMEIGAHTVHHVDLTLLSTSRAQHEVAGSAASLQRWLATPISSFAYPAGKVNAAVAATVSASGFMNAVTTAPGRVTASSNPYLLPRYRVLRGGGMHLLSQVLGRGGGAVAESQSELAHIARERIEGNDPSGAEAVALALLDREFPEQVLKVHVLASQTASVAGIMLSGVKFHRPLTRGQFSADVKDMVELAFEAVPHLDEVDVWAIVPVSVNAGAVTSGDYAIPTSRTVFSVAVRHQDEAAIGSPVDLGIIYWDPRFLR